MFNVMTDTRFFRFMRPDPTVKTAEDCITDDLAMRQNLTERQIDDIIEDTFPASDPAPWY